MHSRKGWQQEWETAGHIVSTVIGSGGQATKPQGSPLPARHHLLKVPQPSKTISAGDQAKEVMFHTETMMISAVKAGIFVCYIHTWRALHCRVNALGERGTFFA